MVIKIVATAIAVAMLVVAVWFVKVIEQAERDGIVSFDYVGERNERK